MTHSSVGGGCFPLFYTGEKADMKNQVSVVATPVIPAHRRRRPKIRSSKLAWDTFSRKQDSVYCLKDRKMKKNFAQRKSLTALLSVVVIATNVCGVCITCLCVHAHVCEAKSRWVGDLLAEWVKFSHLTGLTGP